MTTSTQRASYRVRDLGVIDYHQAYNLQKQTVESILQGGPQTILLCEHPAILTVGRLAQEQHVLVSRQELKNRGVKIVPIDRGGDVTLHAPGQLVIYPLLDLTRYGKNLRSYLTKLEQVAIDLLIDFDIVASRFPGQTGVWVGEKKIASTGIGVRQWISYHGLAINVNTDLSLFSMIKPCGLDVQMTSISEVKGKTTDMNEVKMRLLDCLRRHFMLTHQI